MNIEILKELENSVIKYDYEEGLRCVKKAVEEKIDLEKILEVLTKAIKSIGNGYSSGDLFLPDLIGGAKVVETAMPVVLGEFKKQGKHRKGKGIIVAGTVFGDIHSIGITMVSALAEADGFEVINLGVNVKSNEFVKSVINHNANILAMSALLTTTAAELRGVITLLEKNDVIDKVKVIVGGGAVTEDFAMKIKADGYASTAPRGVTLFNKYLD